MPHRSFPPTQPSQRSRPAIPCFYCIRNFSRQLRRISPRRAFYSVSVPRAAQKFLHHTHEAIAAVKGFPPAPEVALLGTASLYFYLHSQLLAPTSPRILIPAPQFAINNFIGAIAPRRAFSASVTVRIPRPVLHQTTRRTPHMVAAANRAPPRKTFRVHALNHDRAICRSPCAKVQAASPLHVPRAPRRSLRAVSHAAPALCRNFLAPPHQTATFVNRRPRLSELRF